MDSQIHKCFGRVGDGVSYEFDIGTRVKGDWGLLLDAVGLLLLWCARTHFFEMRYRSTLPRVWSSFSNANDAAVSVEPRS